jgi:hypothetical protein
MVSYAILNGILFYKSIILIFNFPFPILLRQIWLTGSLEELNKKIIYWGKSKMTKKLSPLGSWWDVVYLHIIEMIYKWTVTDLTQ